MELDIAPARKDTDPLLSRLKGHGHYKFELIRDGKKVDEWEVDNLAVNQGLNDMLAVYFQGGSQKTSWFMGLFQGNYAPVATDTGANWAANATECSSYSSPTRPAWTPAAPASQQITNAANPASFTFNANVTIYGAAIVSNNVVGGVAGTLFSEAQFASPKPVQNGDNLLVTYGYTIASD
jgi:hypothetical protein